MGRCQTRDLADLTLTVLVGVTRLLPTPLADSPSLLDEGRCSGLPFLSLMCLRTFPPPLSPRRERQPPYRKQVVQEPRV